VLGGVAAAALVLFTVVAVSVVRNARR